MALQTKGFALSEMPRAPAIPGNVGLVDVKAIYDGVKRGLDTIEAARRAPASAVLADAQMAAETAQAPLATRLALAQTQGVEAQTPLNTAILAEKASPEYMAAQRQALLNKSVRAPSPAVQLARNYADAQTAADEDPTNKQKLDLAEAYRLQLNKAGSSTVGNIQGAIDAGLTKNAATNATNLEIATGKNETQTNIADANRATKETLTGDTLALRESLAKQGFSQSEINTRIAAQGRIDANKALATGKIYETAAQKNENLQQSLGELKALNDKTEAYINSPLGAGVIVGSGPMVAVRAIFGDTTGKELVAATSIAMKGAVETMRGLGAMSEKEFGAAMSQLPTTNDPPEAIKTKMDFINRTRTWLAARNAMFMERMETGDPVMVAHAKVRLALPLVGPDGNIVDPLNAPATSAAPSPGTPTASATPTTTVPEFNTPEEADAAGAAGTLQPGQSIRVGGRPAKWNP